MAGEFMGLLNGVTRLIIGVCAFIGFGIVILFVLMPYFALRNANDAIKRATSVTRIWLVEENAAIEDGRLASPFPFIDGHGKNCPAPKYYVCVNSFKDAEDWLLSHGYKKTIVCTQTLGASESNKEFFVRYVTGTRAVYSYISLMVDYGDYDIRLIPYHYRKGQSPIDFSRFATEDWSATGGDGKTPELNNQPPMGWASTDACGSHTFGRESTSNYDQQQSFNWDRYIAAVK